MTMSIAARDPLTGTLGVAIASSSIAVTSRCANVRAGVGAALSQNVTDPSLGRQALDLMESGHTAENVIDVFMHRHPFMAWRQIVLVPVVGALRVFSGSRALGLSGESVRKHCAAAGNLLANPNIPREMTHAFEETPGHIAARLLEALRAGLDAGGEAGPLHAAGLQVADKLSWPVVDLRVDWSDHPIQQLRSLWDLYQPQLDAYVQRANFPNEAPAYGVAGDP